MNVRALGLFASLAACRTAAPEAEPPVAPSLPASVPVEIDALHPHVHAGVPPDRLPTRVFVDLARPAWHDLDVGAKPVDGTRLTIEPPVPGSLAWTDPSRLVFTPDAPLPFATTLTVTLAAIDTGEGPQTLASPVVARIVTPAFAVDRVEVVGAADGGTTRRLAVAFTGPVDVAEALARLHVRIAGGPELDVVPDEAEDGARVGFLVRGEALREASALEVTVEAGTPAAVHAGVVAPAVARTVSLPPVGAPPLALLRVSLREGASGFAVEVACRDASIPGEGRWQWDEEAYEGLQVSDRCDVDPASVADHVRLVPDVPFEIVPSGMGFRIRADLARGPLRVRFDAGLRTRDGGVLAEPVESVLAVGPRRPTLRWTSSGRYLPRDAWPAMPLRHRNVGRAQLDVAHVPARNLMFWMTGWNEQADERTSEQVARTTVPLPSPLDAEVTTWVPIADLVPSPKPGVYQITVTADGASDVARVVVTDLELVAKRSAPVGGRPAWDVWVLGVHDHQPISGVEVGLVRPNGQTIARCPTARDGRCTVAWTADLDPTPPVAIVATRGDDLTYLRFDDLRLTPSEDDVQGIPWDRGAAWRATAWTERGVYRPGETVHLAGLLRQADGSAPATPITARVDVTDPLGRPQRRASAPVGAAGQLAVDLPLPPLARTGRWDLAVLVADEVVARRSVFVEAFAPERLAVTARLDAAAYTPESPVYVGVEARWRFGGPAAGAPVELRCRIEPGEAAPSGAVDLAFGPVTLDGERSEGAVDLGLVVGRLDDAGRGRLACPTAAPSPVAGRLVAEVAVLEGGSGRASRATASARRAPDRVMVGLDTRVRRVEAGRPVVLAGALLDVDGRPVAATTELRVERFRIEDTWDWRWDERSGTESVRRWRRRVPDGAETVRAVAGRFQIPFTPAEAADGYLVRVSNPAGRAVAERVFDMAGRWAFESAWTGTDTPPPQVPGAVRIAVPDEVAVGEAARVTFESPFTGRALVTVETERIESATWMDVVPGSHEVVVRVPREVPNAYVTVLVLKDPHAEDASAFRPERAFGARRLRVTPASRRLAVTVRVPAELRSETMLPVDVAVAGADGPVFVAVAAVDEGVLALTRHETPDPVRGLFPDHALGVETFETVGWSRGAPPRRAGRIGGDAVTPVGTVRAVRPVALWSGWIEARGGRATVELPVPAWRGTLRVAAWAADPRRSGHTEASVVVRDPVTVTATFPRFLTQGDRAEIPVEVANLSGTTADVAVRLAARALALGGAAPSDTPIALDGADRAKLRLGDGESRTVVFRVRALTASGGVAFEATAEGAGVTVRERGELALVPDAPTVRRVVRRELPPGDTPLAPLLAGWLPATERTTVWITANPHGEALARVAEVVHEPWGCLEQSTSSTRPLLTLRDAAPGVLPTVADAADLDRLVRAGLDRVLDMRLPSGAFASWPGGREEAPPETVAYALHLLLDARSAGHAVPPEVVAEATAWLAAIVDTRPALSPEDLRSDAYVHLVLALAGSPRKARARQVLDALRGDDLATAEARYLAGAALWLGGDRRDEAALRRPTLPASASRDRPHWDSYASPLRARARVLATHATLFPDDTEATEGLAILVADELARRGPGGATTQELGWAVTALGRRASGAAQRADVVLRQGTDPLDPETVASGRPDVRWVLARASERPDLVVRRIGDTGRLSLVVSSTGARSDTPWRAEGRGLGVTRRFRAADGRAIDPGAVALGDLVFVELAVADTTGGGVPDVALTDRLPAGWTIELPSLGGAEAPPWLDPAQAWAFTHLDAGDDRLEVFGDVPAGGTVAIVYAVRATSAGAFALPPATAEAMYDPSIRGVTPALRASVRGGWEASWL